MRKLVSWKKLFLLVLCVCMVVSLVACANTNGSSNNHEAGVDVQADLGVESRTPGDSVNKVISAVTAVAQNKKYLNTGFSGVFKLDFSNNNAVNVKMNVRASIRPESSKDSKFSVELNQSGDDTHKARLLLGLYFDGEVLKLDARGLGGKFTVVDTDIVYLLNFISTKLSGADATAQAFDIDQIGGVISTLVTQLVEKDIIKVYEKYIEDGGYQQVSISFDIREVIKFATNALPSLPIDSTEIVKVLNKVYDTLPISSALNLSIGVRGANNSYELVNGSLKVTSHIINVEGLISDIDFSNQAGNVAKPINEPNLDPGANDPNVDWAKLGGFGLDVSLGLAITDGNISIADIDKAIGGILGKLVKDLNNNSSEQDKVNIDFSKNQIFVKENTDIDLRVAAQFQLDIKDNNKTNLLLEIYLDKNDPGHVKGKCDPGEALIQIYYVGRDQAFYVDLSGLGKSDTLPNKLKIDRDFDGNRINLTHLFTHEFLDLIIVNGKVDFTPLITLIQDMINPSGDDSAITTSASDDAARINEKMLEASVPLVLDGEGQAQPDVMKIVKIILQELNFDKNSADVLSGISIRLTSKMMTSIFKEAFVGSEMEMGDITIFDEVFVGLHLTLDEGLKLEVKAVLDANDYADPSGTIAGFPIVTINVNANIEPFKAFEMDRLPDDKDKGGWQTLQLVKKEKDGAIDLLGSLLATVQDKKIYVSASVNLQLDVSDSDGNVDVGPILSSTIGGSLGAALADLQMRTGNLDVDYTLTLTANVDLASILSMDTTADIMTLIKQILPDQQVMISLEQIKNRGAVSEERSEVLSILLAHGKVYVFAEALGIPKSVIDINAILDMIPASGASGPESTVEENSASNPAILVLALLSNIDIITVMQDSLAITLNASFLNVIMEMLLPDFPIDLTVSQIGVNIKLKSDTFKVEEVNESLLNQIELDVNLATDIAGVYFSGGLAVGGLNIGLFDSEGGKYDVERVFFADKDVAQFVNPLGNTLVNIGLSGKFRLTSDGVYKFLDEDGTNKYEGEIGSILNTLALVIGTDNLNLDLELKLEAALDLFDTINNRSQVALQITQQNKVILGLYVYDKSVYVDLPALFVNPFKLDVDIANIIVGIINGDVALGASEDALTTAGAEGEAEAMKSLISLTNKNAQARLSSNMLKGLVATLLGTLSTGDAPAIDSRVADDLIDLVHSLPFDIMVIGGLNYGSDDSKKGLLQNLNVSLNAYVGKGLIDVYSAEVKKPGNENKSLEEIFSTPLKGVVGLGIELGGITVGYRDGNDVIDIIRQAISNQNFDYVGSIDDIQNIDFNKILKDTELSLSADISLAISAGGVTATSDNTDILLGLKDIIGTLPDLFVKLGVLHYDGFAHELINIHMHLAATVNVGELLKGNYNKAIMLSLGLFTKPFTSYEDYAEGGLHENEKILSIIAMPETVANATTMTLFIDSNGFSQNSGAGLVRGKIKIDGLDLNEVLGGSSEAVSQADDYPTTITNFTNIIEIINNTLSKITLSNNAIGVDFGSNILAVVVNLLTNQDGSANVEVLPLTSGRVELRLKQETLESGEVVYPGIYANLGLRKTEESDPAFNLGIGITNIKLAFSTQGKGFIYGIKFDSNSYTALREIESVSLNAQFGLDIDLKEGVKNINLMNYYNSFLGQAQAAIIASQVKDRFTITNGPGMNGLHLGVRLFGTLGIQNVDDTYIKLQVLSFSSKKNRESGNSADAKVFLDARIYKDTLYVTSDILNITPVKVPNINLNKLIAEKLLPIITGSFAQGTAEDPAPVETDSNVEGGLQFLIGDRTMELAIGKTFLKELLPMLITSVPSTFLSGIVDELFGALKISADLETMSASINLIALANDNKDNKNDVSHLLDFTLAIDGFEVSAFDPNTSEEISNLVADNRYAFAEHNALVELGASLTLERDKIVKDTQLTPDNIFGKLAGIVSNLDMLDQGLRETINGVLQGLYIDIVASGTPAQPGTPDDDVFAVTLKVLVQANLDWTSWQRLDLHDSSFRLAIADAKDNILFDIYVIGTNNTLYVSAPFLGVDEAGNVGTNIKITGFNLIELIESAGAQSQSALATADDSISVILNLVNQLIGDIKFSGEGIQLGLGVVSLKAVASALGLIPSLSSGLVDAVGSLDGELDLSKSGLYVHYPEGDWDNTNMPQLRLALNIKNFGGIEIGLNHYALGIADLDDLTTSDTLPFINKEGLKQLVDFTLDNDGKFKNISKMQTFQVRVRGSLSAGFNGVGTDLTGIFRNVVGGILGVLPLRELGLKLYSDVINKQSLNIEAAVHIDLTGIGENLEIDLTIFNENDTVNGVPQYKYENTLLRIYYAKDTLYVKAPGYLNEDVMRIEHLGNMFSGLGASTQATQAETAPKEENIPQNLAALELAFGTKSVSVKVLSGVFNILLQVLEGTDINLSKDAFKALEGKFDIGIELGSLNNENGYYLPDLYAGVTVHLDPITLGISLQEPEVKVATNESLMPTEMVDGATKTWAEMATHFSEVTFRIKASGRIGLEANTTKILLDNILKDFGINESFAFDVNLEDPNDTNHKPLNLHLGLELDAELCLGDFSKCNIKLQVNAYRNAQKFTTKAPSQDDLIDELLALYVTNGTVFLDLRNSIINLGVVNVNKIAIDDIMQALQAPMTTTEDPATGASAIATGDEMQVIEEAIFLSNLIKLKFNSAVDVNGSSLQELGSIEAEIGAVVINKIFAMLGFDFLAQGKIAGVVKIDMPSSNSRFGIGLNIKSSPQSKLINGLGLYVWLGDFQVLTQKAGIYYDDKGQAVDTNLPSADIVEDAMDLSRLMDQSIHVGLTANLSMMRSKYVKGQQIGPDGSIVESDGNKNGFIMDTLLTDFFDNVVPWMDTFLAQLEVLGTKDVEEFYSSHAVKLQANINLGMLINRKTCTACGKDFTGTEPEFVNDHVCPHCGVSEDKTINREFYLDEIDLALEVVRNNKQGQIDDAVTPGDVVTKEETLLGIYVENSEIKFYGSPFGLSNFTISKESVESIAKTVTSILAGTTSEMGSAISTAEPSVNENTQPQEEASINIIGLLNNLIRTVYVSMYTVRVGIADNILSYVPELTKALGIKGFPEYGYPSIGYPDGTNNNYIEVGLIANEKIDPSITINLDMFGITTSIAIDSLDIGIGDPEDPAHKIKVPTDATFEGNLTAEGDSIIDFNVEAELKLNLNKADTNIQSLIGGLLGDLNAGYIVDETISKNFVLRIQGQIDIKDYTLVLGVEIVELYDNNGDGVADYEDTIIGIYYDSKESAAYINTGFLSKFKITGLELDTLLAKLASEEADATAGTASFRPILNHDIIEKNSEIPSVKATIALQQYFAVAVSAELINQIVHGIDVLNTIPKLPDFEIGVKLGREKDETTGEYGPFAITLQAGLGKNTQDVGTGFLVDLSARIYLGPIKKDNAFIGGTFVNIINQETAKGTRKIIKDEQSYPEILHISFDTEGNIVPEFRAEAIQAKLAIDLDLGMEKGTNDFAYMFEQVFGADAEITAIAKAKQSKHLNVRVSLEAQINLKNLLLPLITGGDMSLDGTNIKIRIDKLNPEPGEEPGVLELTVVGGGATAKEREGNDAIYLRIFGFERDTLGNHPDTCIVIDTMNILQMVGVGASSSTSAISTANEQTAITGFINALLKDIHITNDKVNNNIGIHINFMPRVFDKVFELIPILMAESKTGDDLIAFNELWDKVGKLQLPTITEGGLFINIKQNPEAKDNVGFNLGLDVTFDSLTKVMLGISIDNVTVQEKVDHNNEIATPTLDKGKDVSESYTQIDKLKLQLNLKAFVEVKNTNSPDPISIGGLVTSILGMLNMNIGGDVNLNLNTVNTEKFVLALEGYIDMEDFVLEDKLDENGKYPTRGNKQSRLKVSILKTGDKPIVQVYLDFMKNSVYVDLTGLIYSDKKSNIGTKLKITGLDLAQMLGDVISPVLGGTTQVASAQAGESNLKNSKLSALMYLTVDKEMAQLRFNSDLIYGLLDFILGIVSKTTDGSADIMGVVKELNLPDFGEISLTANTNKIPKFELKINRLADVVDDNYISLGIEDAFVLTHFDGTTVDTLIAPPEYDKYASVFDIATGALTLGKIGINASVNIDLDFSNQSTKNDPYTFTRYISRLLAILIDGNEDQKNVDKYEVKIIGDGANKKLRYTLNVSGQLDINDIFGGSDLAIELWKMDMVTSVGKVPITNPNDVPSDASDKHVMLLGAYLKKDVTNGFPTLYVDLNNLGLPRIKLVGIDSLFGSAVSTAANAQSDVIGTGDYSVAQAENGVVNEIVVDDDKVSIRINRGLLYGVLEMLLPDICKDGYINAGGLSIPLPKMRGVEANINLKNGLEGIEIKAYLEQNTSNYLGIGLTLNSVEIGGKKENQLKPFNWSDVHDKYQKNVSGETYFAKFGTVHIGTSFAADMLTSIVDSVDPELLIDLQKRGNGTSFSGNNKKDLYNRINEGTGWNYGRMGQSWNQILLKRGPNNTAQNLVLDINSQSGASLRHNHVSVTVSPDAVIHANLGGALSVTEDLKEAVGAIKDIAIPLGAPSLGDMILPGQGANSASVAISTAEEYDPFAAAFGNFEISDFIRGISLRIYTAKENGTFPKTVVQVKVDPEKINGAFQAINALLCGIFDPETKTNPNYKIENIHKNPYAITDGLVKFLSGPSIAGGLLGGLVADEGKQSALGNILTFIADTARRELWDFIGSILPFPYLNLNPGNNFKMPVTNDQTPGEFETVRSELNITLDYDKNNVKIFGALKSIKAEFGNDYGFNKAPLGKAANAINAMNESYYTNGNYDMAKTAVDNNLGYLLLNIGANDGKPIGFKSVDKVTGYRDNGLNALKEKTVGYYDTSSNVWKSTIPAKGVDETDKAYEVRVNNFIESKSIIINDALLATTTLKDAIHNETNGKLPTKADVLYTDGTSTGGAMPDQPGTALPISIVWDDSRIKINPNGSSPQENGDNYLYGWVQNILIAKIPVRIVSDTYEYKGIIRSSMSNRDEDSAVKLEMIDPSKRIDILADGPFKGYANMRITLKTYITKNLPEAITFAQGTNRKEVTYTTSAVKRIVYKSTEKDYQKEYNTETEEGLTQIYDPKAPNEGGTTGRYVQVEQAGWNGDWYYSKTRKTPVDGKLEWDMTNLNWSIDNPFDVNKEVGGATKTVKMKLTTGKFDVFELDNIIVEVDEFLTKEQIILAINEKFGVTDYKQLNINILKDPNFIDKINDISQIKSDGTRTGFEGKGLLINFASGNKLKINNDEIEFNLKNYEDWLLQGNKFEGTVFNIPVTITKFIPNRKEINGKEKIVFKFNLPVNIERIEFLDAEFAIITNGMTMPLKFKLNPYISFEDQLANIFSPKEKAESAPDYGIKMIYRTTNGKIASIVQKIGTSRENVIDNNTGITEIYDSLDYDMINTTLAEDTKNNIVDLAKVKLDIKSIYGKYDTNGAVVSMHFAMGNKKIGFIHGDVPVEIAKVTVDRNLEADIVNEVNVLDKNTFTNIPLLPEVSTSEKSLTKEEILANKKANAENAKKIRINVTQSGVSVPVDFDIVWYDEQALANKASTGLVSGEILKLNAVIGFKQPGETNETLNNFLNKRIVLKISKIATIKDIKLENFTGDAYGEKVTLVYNRQTGEYFNREAIKSSTGTIKYTYVTKSGDRTPGFIDVKLGFNLATKKTHISIGLFDFVLNLNDDVTKVLSIGEKTNSAPLLRDFTVDADGNYVVKYAFCEKLPVSKDDSTKMVVVVELATPDGIVTKDIELVQDKNNLKMYKGTFRGPYADTATGNGGPYTITIIVTK